MAFLPMRTKTIHTVQDSDLDRFISQVYGVEFNFVADNEVGNDSSVSFAVDGVLDDYERDEVAKFARGEVVSYISRTLLNDACARGLIPAGDYLVSVCW